MLPLWFSPGARGLDRFDSSARAVGPPGRRRLIRILEVHDKVVVVDTNHRWAGQAVDLEVELVAIEARAAGPEARLP